MSPRPPMMRALVGLLLLANLAYLGWAQGWLRALGVGPARVNEPERLQSQQRPEALRLLSAASAAAARAATPATRCWRVGPFDDAQRDALRTALDGAGLSARWRLDTEAVPGRWMIYMGRYADGETLARKKAELRSRGVAFEVLQNPALAPGLSLGVFDDQARAEAALAQLGERGVRTARVMTLQPPVTRHWLTITSADDALRTRLQAQPALAQRAWQQCNGNDAGTTGTGEPAAVGASAATAASATASLPRR